MAIIFEKEKLTMVYHLQLSEPTLRHQIKEQFKVVNWGLRRKDFGTKKKKNPPMNQMFLMFAFKKIKGQLIELMAYKILK